MATPPKRIGFCGLGLMGQPMFANLVKKLPSTTTFYIYDVVQSALEEAATSGAGRVHICQNAKQVADESDVIITMVPAGAHVRSVYLTPETGILVSTTLADKLLLDCSTIDPSTSLAVRDALKASEPLAHFYDAPVSGGVAGAVAGTLTFMLGIAASDPNLAAILPLLKLMGSNVFPCGGPALGLTAKLCNNYCSALIAIATSESLNLGIASGMDPRVLANIFHTSTAQSAICDDWNPVPGLSSSAPASNDYQGGFRVELMRKDFGLAVDAARENGVRLALGEPGLKVYDEACADERCKGRDSRVVYRSLGGRENWREDFPEEVGMRKDETKKALKLGRDSTNTSRESGKG